MKKRAFSFEIYTKNPQTGEEGWDIKFVNVFATDKKEAKEQLKKIPNFDVVILYNGDSELTAEQAELAANGITSEYADF